MKRSVISAILAAVALVGLTACEEDILESMEAYVSLDTENTYMVGEEIRFKINGDADYVYFYSGEVGSQYEYRDRTVIDMEDLESCKLVLECQARYGSAGALDIYASKNYADGFLKGNDAQADFTTMTEIQNSMDESKNIPGWEKLDYQEGASTKTTTQEFDITEYADSFCLAFHWNVATHTATQRTYWINVYLKTKFKGYDEVTMTGHDLGMTAVCMNSDYISDPYYQDKGNGSVRFTGAWDIIMQGVGADVLPYALNSWVVTKPRPLNNITPDTGYSVKAIADNTKEYVYTYTKPGKYKATFVMTNANYQGVERKVQDVVFNIIEPIKAE